MNRNESCEIVRGKCTPYAPKTRSLRPGFYLCSDQHLIEGFLT